jgi:hypothetical protein
LYCGLYCRFPTKFALTDAGSIVLLWLLVVCAGPLAHCDVDLIRAWGYRHHHRSRGEDEHSWVPHHGEIQYVEDGLTADAISGVFTSRIHFRELLRSANQQFSVCA